MLARSVHSLKRLFVEKAHKTMRIGGLPQNLHNEHVVVNSKVQILKHRSELKLSGSHFVVARLRGNAELPKALLHLCHKVKNPRADCAEIVIVKLLMLGRCCAKDSSPCLEKVGTLQIKLLIDKEIFLLRSKRHGNVRFRTAKLKHETLCSARDGLN